MSEEPPTTTQPPEDSRSAGMGAAFPLIQGYEITRELSRGGQGVVYQAVQLSTKRKVAIKILLDGALASPAAHRRFLREIELAASLRHPNIISVFDSGLTTHGREFCVMDYIRGRPITDYLRENRLPIDDALRLFRSICDAVAHAHQRGVIHRDLKPSNILVDSEGSARILDFGLAKTVTDRSDAMMTQTGQLLGTVRYMSPEQTRGNPDEIDTRSDVYSLGIVLYEMLTGGFPYPVDGPLQDVLGNITTTEPISPMRTWSKERGIQGRAGRTARREQCPIDAELVTLVSKALAKDREHRYQSAGELSRDLGHYLAREPIEASGDSALYLLRKTLARYRGPVFAAALILLVAAAGLGVSAVAWRRTAVERDAERTQRQQAQASLALANEEDAISRLILARAYSQQHQFILARNMIDSVDSTGSLSQDWRWSAWEFLRRSGELSSIDLNGYLAPGERMSPALDSNGLAAIDPANGLIWTEANLQVRVFDLETGRPRAVPFGLQNPIVRAFFNSPVIHREGNKGGRHVAIDAAGWPERTESSITLFKPNGSVAWKEEIPLPGLSGAAALASDGSLVALAMLNGTIEIRRVLDDRTEIAHVIDGVHDHVTALAFDPSVQRLHVITGSWFHRVFTIRSDADIDKIAGAHTETVRRLSFDGAGRLLASGGYDGHIKVWDVRTHGLLADLVAIHKVIPRLNGLTETRFIPDGRIFSNDTYAVARLWDWHSGNCISCDTGAGHQGGIAISDDGRTIYSATGNQIQRWSMETGKPDGNIFGYDGAGAMEENYRVLWLQNQNRLIVLRSSGYYAPPRPELVRCQVWDTQGLTLVRELKHHTDGLRDVDMSPDGKMLAIASRDGTATLWHWQSGELLHVLPACPGHSDLNIVSSVKFDPSEPVVVTGSHDNRVLFWSTQTGRQLAEIDVDEQHQRGFGPAGLLKDVAFSPDGKTLAITVGGDIWWLDMGFFDQEISNLTRGHS